MANDPSTLASTGLLLAELFAIVAGLVALLEDFGSMQDRLLALTSTVDIGDVAVLGIAVALLLVTPDPPGGIPRTFLLQCSAVLAVVITVFALIRAVVLLVQEGAFAGRAGGSLATLGVAIAAATIAFYAAKESARKEGEDAAAGA
jgi:hypothetical protein